MTMPMMPPPGLPDVETAAYELAENVGQPMPEAEPLDPRPQLENLLPPDEYQSDPELLRRSALVGLYGSDFPLIDMERNGQEPSREKWATWGRSLWARHRGPMMRRLWLTERNRKMYKGEQWVTSIGMGPWKEPPKPRDVARRTRNVIKPAIDMRVEIVSEQRPGFRTKPTNQDPQKIKRAEAQQVFIEYQYDQQRMDLITQEASHYAATDGVAFLHTYWDADRGPWYEFGDGAAPLGDMITEVLRIEQVRVSSYASLTRRPTYVVIRKVVPLAEAIRVWGDEVAHENDRGDDASSWLNEPGRRIGTDIVGIEESMIDQETVDHYTVYCDKSEYLPEGLTLHVIGQRAVYLGPLVCGTIPVAPWRDGSSDPAYFPTPIMEDWIDDQMTINATMSKWIESIRKNADGRLLARPNTIVNETLVGGALSVVEVKAPTSINDAVAPMPSFSVGGDAKEMLQLATKSFEDKSGWNDASRGSVASNTSGRAVLAIREQLERTFAPTVGAASEAMTEWAKICLHWAKWGYELPRLIAVTGAGRSDLAREVTNEDFDGVADVEIDPETMMPLPRTLRLFLLDNMLEKGLLDPAEYRRRMPFAFVQNLESSDTVQLARAKRVADAIKNGMPVPEMRWQDNESIHQDVLEREIILADDANMPPQVVMMASQRWDMLSQQAAMKQGGMPPMGGAPGGPPAPPQGPPPGGGQGLQLDPQQAPLYFQNSSIASAPAKQLAAQSDPMIAAMLQQGQ